MDIQAILDRTDRLIGIGTQVASRSSDQQYVMGLTGRLVPGQFAQWRAQAAALLRGTLPPNHTYVDEFERSTTPTRPNDPLEEDRDYGLGVLRAFRDDLANGDLAALQSLIAADVFADFMEMSQHLLANSYIHAATSIAGAVLEDSLRRVLNERGAKSNGNLESLNQVSLDTGLYTRPVWQQVKIWIGLRNDADHGAWDAVTTDRVEPFIRDLPTFLASRLDLG